LPSHHHAPEDVLARRQALQDLHTGDANSDANPLTYLGSGRIGRLSQIGVGGELDQVSGGIWREGLKNGAEELANASNPEFDLEGVI
jgi:hypothetical protein